MTLARDVVRILIEAARPEPGVVEINAELEAELVAAAETYGSPLLPSPDERVAVTFNARKTAALLFDRVWSVPAFSDSTPPGVAVYGATGPEISAQLLYLIGRRDAELQSRIVRRAAPQLRAMGWSLYSGSPVRHVAELLAHAHGTRTTPLYTSEADRNQEYVAGDVGVVFAALHRLRIVDEAALTWEQVLEFRDDKRSVADYRRLMHWLDKDLVGKSASFVHDEIAARLEDYEAALRKHGILTLVGAIESTLDPKVLAAAAGATAAASVAGYPFAGLLAGLTVGVGRVIVTVARGLVDLDQARRDRSEVAFIHNIGELTEKAAG